MPELYPPPPAHPHLIELRFLTMTTLQAACRVCDHHGPHAVYTAAEHMLEMGGQFRYYQCTNCECLQIAEVPADLSRFYPANYYSFKVNPTGPLKRMLRRQRNRYALSGTGWLGRLLYMRHPYPQLASMRLLQPDPSSNILDVGCGGGELLHDLRGLGFSELHGVDRYLLDELHVPGLNISREDFNDTTGCFDLIMFHHCFEHLSNPRETLQHVARLLSPSGRCLLRLPTVPCVAWDTYREHWAQLDAPRHLFLHSRHSLTELAVAAGLRIAAWTNDSTGFQFWGSEQYLRGVGMFSPQSYLINPGRSGFTRQQIMEYQAEAERLNLRLEGDQSVVILVPFAEHASNSKPE